MYFSGLALAFFVSSVLGAASSVHTDAHAVTCQSFSISWAGGTAPFQLVRFVDFTLTFLDCLSSHYETPPIQIPQ
ncbi:hypothetical protein B0H13DRAFT_519190 [Mycena leptocephala]|nr:hypothetical protein B0H13DRAFT_519190 [Mycena leptocephala]